MVRQADDPFVCFGAKTDEEFGLEISTRPEVGKGTPVGVGKRNPEEGSWRRETESGSWSRHRTPEETNRHERKPRVSEGRPVKMSQPSSWFVEFSQEIHASISLHMHRECSVT